MTLQNTSELYATKLNVSFVVYVHENMFTEIKQRYNTSCFVQVL